MSIGYGTVYLYNYTIIHHTDSPWGIRVIKQGLYKKIGWKFWNLNISVCNNQYGSFGSFVAFR